MLEMHNRQSDVSYSFLGTREDDEEDEIIPVLPSSSQFFNQNPLHKKNQLNSCK